MVKIISLLDVFKKLVISNKCIPDDEEMKQTLQTSQEQSAISIIRFLFDLFYIKPIDVINTKVYTNSIEDITSELNSDERIISISKVIQFIYYKVVILLKKIIFTQFKN